MMRTFKHSMLAALVGLSCLYGNAAVANPGADDTAVYSFAFFGCNRLNKEGVDATGFTSTANEAQLLQSFRDIAAQPALPRLLFLAGDIVKGKKPGTKTLAKQLDAWVELAADPQKNPLVAKGVPIVAFTGNHELLVNKEDSDVCKYWQCPNPPAYGYWQEFMENNPAGYDFIAGHNGPKKGGADGLLVDETRLSYSFRNEDVLFVVLNTDTMIDSYTIGDVPMHWLGKQLRKAQKDKAIRHVFVMGHKPLQNAAAGDHDDPGNPAIRPEQAEALYRLLNDPAGDGSATKVRAYLAAHAHEWSFAPALAFGDYTGKVPQVVAGNGGSPPESTWRGKDAYFGYTIVEILRDGRIATKSYGRPINDPYFEQKDGATTLRAMQELFLPK